MVAKVALGKGIPRQEENLPSRQPPSRFIISVSRHLSHSRAPASNQSSPPVPACSPSLQPPCVCFNIALTFLLAPKACASPSLSPCPLDPSYSPYSTEAFKEDPCFRWCVTSCFYVVMIVLLVINIYILTCDWKAGRHDGPGKKNKSVQCV